MQTNKKFAKNLFYFFLFISAFSIHLTSGCTRTIAIPHGHFFTAEITFIKGDRIDLCVGERENVTVGKEYRVFKKIINPANRSSCGRVNSFQANTRLFEVGAIKVTGYIDDKLANAVIVRGNISQGNLIFLDD